MRLLIYAGSVGIVFGFGLGLLIPYIRNNDAICALAFNRKQQLEEMQIQYLQYKINAYEEMDSCPIPNVMDDSRWLEESYEDLDD
jgi:hypothetical protein